MTVKQYDITAIFTVYGDILKHFSGQLRSKDYVCLSACQLLYIVFI